jgi:hypothetical protein
MLGFNNVSIKGTLLQSRNEKQLCNSGPQFGSSTRQQFPALSGGVFFVHLARLPAI